MCLHETSNKPRKPLEAVHGITNQFYLAPHHYKLSPHSLCFDNSVTSFLRDYTSATWLTNYPIVYVGFDHAFQTFQSTASSDDSLSGGVVEFKTGRPVWTGGLHHYCLSETAVVCKCVAVDQGPAFPVSFHITVNLKQFFGSELDPVSF